MGHTSLSENVKNLLMGLLAIMGVLVLSSVPALSKTENNRVVIVTVADAIGPAIQDYIERSFEYAQSEQADLIVIRLDTPGGLDGAMRTIIQTITTSPVPVVTYVAPTGARAASAGTYILFASHIAAMAPGTNLGAATPVQIQGPSLPGPKKPDTGDEKKDLPVANDAMKNKIINDASAYIRGLADLHGRNADWAEQAVRDGVSLQASEALKVNVIDVIANDIDDLLQQLDGRSVQLHNTRHVLRTQDAELIEVEPDWRNRLLSVITNPNVAYLLMMVGMYGLILEFYNPGGLVPGIVGAICMVLALYAFQLLPINYAGFALILLGMALMVAEGFQPSFGMLGIGGVIAFVIGSIILLDTEVPQFRIYLSVVVSVAVATIFVLLLVVSLAIRARSRPVVSGIEELIGKVTRVNSVGDQESVSVYVHSELWRAHSRVPLEKGQWVRITAVDGLTLEVEPVSDAVSTVGGAHPTNGERH